MSSRAVIGVLKATTRLAPKLEWTLTIWLSEIMVLLQTCKHLCK
jgi:hypothetical protein